MSPAKETKEREAHDVSPSPPETPSRAVAKRWLLAEEFILKV